jgi:hypothetical protein
MSTFLHCAESLLLIGKTRRAKNGSSSEEFLCSPTCLRINQRFRAFWHGSKQKLTFMDKLEFAGSKSILTPMDKLEFAGSKPMDR